MSSELSALIQNPVIVTNQKVLREVSEPFDFREGEVDTLVGLMKQAMKRAWVNGVACSAIQIGVPARVCVYWITGNAGKMERVLVNPQLIKGIGALKPHPGEGCLSIPRSRYTTWRFEEIIYSHEVAGKTIEAKTQGFEAQVIQHEIDHMNGVLCCDRAKKPEAPGRNEPCVCGSQNKYKKCCGR